MVDSFWFAKFQNLFRVLEKPDIFLGGGGGVGVDAGSELTYDEANERPPPHGGFNGKMSKLILIGLALKKIDLIIIF